MRQLDERGQSCPIPVLDTKKAIDAGEKVIEVLVDNNTARQNISRLAGNHGYEFIAEDAPNGEFVLKLSKK